MISKKEQAEFLAEATPYIKKYNDKTRVIKYGGNAMIDEELKASVMRNLVLLQFVGMNVFVHGDVSKIECCNEAIRRGVQKVFITDGRVNHSILMELLFDDYGRNVC